MKGVHSDESRCEKPVGTADTEFDKTRRVRRAHRCINWAKEWEYAYLNDLPSFERNFVNEKIP